jgi:hypothetical protein
MNSIKSSYERENWYGHFSEIHKDKSGTLSPEGLNNNKQCQLQRDAVGLYETSCLSKTLWNGDRGWHCCMQYPSTVDIHQHLKCEVLESPLYIPDLAAVGSIGFRFMLLDSSMLVVSVIQVHSRHVIRFGGQSQANSCATSCFDLGTKQEFVFITGDCMLSYQENSIAFLITCLATVWVRSQQLTGVLCSKKQHELPWTEC